MEHREPDKISFDIRGTRVYGININALKALKRYIGIDTNSEIKDVITQMAETGDDIRD